MKYLNYRFLPLLLVLGSTACTTSRPVSTAWQSRQTTDSWTVSFDQFTGREQVASPRQPQRLLYVSQQLTTVAGQLQVQVDGQPLPPAPGVAHLKLPLTQSR